jgi:predicted nucleotidyltransferase
MESALKAQGLAALYLFGSVARDDASLDSDVDLAFDIAPADVDRFSLIDQSRIRRQAPALRDLNLRAGAPCYVPCNTNEYVRASHNIS